MTFDLKKFELLPGAPKKFAHIIPGHGLHQFMTEFLTDHDCEVLIKAGCKFIRAVDKKKI